MVVDIPDVITYTHFGDHRLRVFWVAGGQIFPSPIDFHRRPYNTFARSTLSHYRASVWSALASLPVYKLSLSTYATHYWCYYSELCILWNKKVTVTVSFKYQLSQRCMLVMYLLQNYPVKDFGACDFLPNVRQLWNIAGYYIVQNLEFQTTSVKGAVKSYTPF